MPQNTNPREPIANEETPSEEVIEAAVKAYPPVDVPGDVVSTSTGQRSTPEDGKKNGVVAPADTGESTAAGTEEWLKKNPGVKA